MIRGLYSDGKTSKALDTFLYITDSGHIGIKNTQISALNFKSVKISPRIGNTSRYIDLPDGSVFETEDNDAIDEIIRHHSTNRYSSLVHRLESSKQLVAVTLLTVILVAWIFIQFGIPHFSREVAMLLSDEHVKYLGVDVFETMDKHLLEDSELSHTKQLELQAIFQSLLDSLHEDDIRLVFRQSKSIGANAFALPDGTILFTDDLINLTEDDNEFIAILLHEIGHLQHRHSLRMAIQGFSLAILITAITGDVSASSSIITSLPAVLIESGYSREMEAEADSYSLIHMLYHNIDPIYFAIMMKKLEASHTPAYQTCINDGKSINDCLNTAISDSQQTDNNDEMLGGYFSSHPGTNERILRFEQASTSFSN